MTPVFETLKLYDAIIRLVVRDLILCRTDFQHNHTHKKNVRKYMEEATVSTEVYEDFADTCTSRLLLQLNIIFLFS